MVGWLDVAGPWAAMVAALAGIIAVVFGWPAWHESRRRPRLDLRVLGPAGFSTAQIRDQEIVQTGAVVETGGPSRS